MKKNMVVKLPVAGEAHLRLSIRHYEAYLECMQIHPEMPKKTKKKLRRALKSLDSSMRMLLDDEFMVPKAK